MVLNLLFRRELHQLRIVRSNRRSLGALTAALTTLTLAQGAIASPSSLNLKQTDANQNLETSQFDADTRFFCETDNGQYTVMYYPESQPEQAYPWASPTALGGGWSAERRCLEIARRLESYRPDGLRELKTGIENGYDIVCATTTQDPSCRIVFTVPPGQDPIVTRDRVFENLAVADAGQQTDAVNTFSGNDVGRLLDQLGNVLDLNLPSRSQQRSSNAIDLRQFLDPADGGTGAQLN